MASSFSSSPRHGVEADFCDNDSFDLDEDPEYGGRESDEDTEDASETDQAKQEEFTEIKEQMYQQKLSQLKKQLGQLKEGTLPEYIKKLKKIEQSYKERLRVNEIWYHYEVGCYQLEVIELEYAKEKKAAVIEFEEKKTELKENLIVDLEDRKRNVDVEKGTIELTGDSMEVKSITTRKLRRRPNDPTPVPEKRRKPSPVAQLNFMLEEDEILDDLKIISKVSGKPLNRKPQNSPAMVSANNADIIYDARIDDGRLYYDKKWFSRTQPVFVVSKDIGKDSYVISAVGTQEIWLRRTSDNGKLRIYVAQLQKGKYILQRRNS